MIEEVKGFRCSDGFVFYKEDEAIKHERENTKVVSESDIRQQVYKNLFEFIKKHNIGDTPSEDVLEFLVVNKKEILLLLTNGNLDTVYAPRDFVKGV